MSDGSYVGRRICVARAEKRGVDYVRARIVGHRSVGSSLRGTKRHIVSLHYDGGGVQDGVLLNELPFQWIDERVPEVRAMGHSVAAWFIVGMFVKRLLYALVSHSSRRGLPCVRCSPMPPSPSLGRATSSALQRR